MSLFSQSVLDKIKASAVANASIRSSSNQSNLCLSDQVFQLIGYKCHIEKLEHMELVSKLILEVTEHIQGEQQKARQGSSLYNFNRHISLHDLCNRLQKKREKLISAL